MEFKLTRRRWDQRDENILREMYGNEPVPVIADKLGRSEGAVRRRASDLQLKSGSRQRVLPRQPWTRSEERVLMEGFHSASTRELAGKLNRSETAIITRARLLGLKNRYAPSE